MKLNPDCIRDILLTVEENTSYGKLMRYPDNYELLKSYEEEEVMYHVKQCELSGLVTKVSYDMVSGCDISDLSPYGHEFLANIRSAPNWRKTKDVAEKVGSSSLSAIIQIASSIISSVIKSNLGI